MTTAVATVPTHTLAKRDTLEALLERPGYQKRFQEVLKERAPQFMSGILSIGRTMPDVEPKSLIGSAMQAAVLDLPIEKNLGFAWMVPYKAGGVKYAQFQMGYKGYIQLALRTGRYERMNARTVNAEALNGFDEVGEPKIDWTKIDETKPNVGYAFGFKLVSGFVKVCYWTREKVIAHAQRYSQAFRAGGQTPWKTEFDKMALKTVIANELSDWGILSVEWQRARMVDQGITRDIDAEVEFIDNAPAPEQIEDRKPEPTDLQRSQTAAPVVTQQPTDLEEKQMVAAAATKSTAQQAQEVTEQRRRGRPPGSKNTPKIDKFSPKEAAVTRKTGVEVAESAIEYPPGKGPQDYDVHGDLIEEQKGAAAPGAEDPDLTAMGLAPEIGPKPEELPSEPAPEFKPRAGESEALTGVRRLMFANGDANKTISEAQLMSFCVTNKLAAAGQKLADLAELKLTNIAKNWAVLLPKLQAIKV